jgi:hypothetical protein
MTTRHPSAPVSRHRRPGRFVLVIVAAGLSLVALGGDASPRWQAAAGDTALASQKCVLCGRAFPNKAARLCNSCSNK